MKFTIVYSLLFCVACVLPGSIAKAEFRAGAAKVDITPANGVSLDGSISKNGPVTSVHDPIHARALVLENDSTRIAIVICDLCMVGRDVFDRAKQLIEQKTKSKIPATNILLAATHTHAAPRAIHIGKRPIDDEYHRLLAEKIAAAVIKANSQLVPARIGYTSFNKSNLLACRRFLCKPGSVGPNPFGETGERIKSVAGKSSAIIEPAGPTDPQFSVLSVQNKKGQPICVLGNFSVHYCGGYKRGAVSADYFGYFSEAIETKLRSKQIDTSTPAVIGIMSNGTSGNTGAFQRSAGQKRFLAFEGMLFYGRMLAMDAINAIEQLSYQQNPTIEMIEHELQLKVRRPDEKRLAWSKQILSTPQSKWPHRWSKIYADEAEHLSTYPETVSMKLQVIRIGDIAIASCPCEVFAETGLAIKKQSPFKKTFTIELANGYGGYLPPRKQHELGGYETWPARSSFLEVDAAKKIKRELLSMLHELAN